MFQMILVIFFKDQQRLNILIIFSTNGTKFCTENDHFNRLTYASQIYFIKSVFHSKLIVDHSLIQKDYSTTKNLY